MVSFADKFKTFISQAQEKVVEYSVKAQAKLVEMQDTHEKQQIEQAKAHFEKQEFRQAIRILKGIHATSENYVTAQDNLTVTVIAYRDQVLQMAAANPTDAFFKEAMIALKNTPNSFAEQALGECVNAYENHVLRTAAVNPTTALFKDAIATLKSIQNPAAEQSLVGCMNAYVDYVVQMATANPSDVSFKDAIATLKSIQNPAAEQALTNCVNAYGNYIVRMAVANPTTAIFKDAIATLKKLPATVTEQAFTDCVNAYINYTLQTAAAKPSCVLFSDAIATLKTIPETVQVYGDIQERIDYLDATLCQIISKHSNLMPIKFEGKTVAAACVDNTLHLVSSISRKSSIYSSLGSTYADGEFIIVRLIVRNDNKKSRTISASMMTLIDSQQREFQVSSQGITALTMNGDQTAEFLVTEIQPGLQKSVTIVFDIPSGLSDLTLKVPSGEWSSSAMLPLSLAL